MSQQHIKIITYQVKVDFIPEVFKIMREIKERNRKLNMNSASFFFFFKYAAAKSLQSCPTLFNPMDYRTPGLPVHHQLLEFTQIHVH